MPIACKGQGRAIAPYRSEMMKISIACKGQGRAIAPTGMYVISNYLRIKLAEWVCRGVFLYFLLLGNKIS